MNNSNDTNTDLQMEETSEPGRTSRNHIWAGLFIVLIGVALLLRQSGFDFPFWLFTWPMILIAFGILGGIKHKFKPGGWIVPILIGGIFLADRLMPGESIQQYAWPILIMLLGVFMIIRPKTHRRQFERCRGGFNSWDNTNTRSWQYNASTPEMPVTRDSSDYIDTTSFFGGIKKIVLSKDFRGGDVVNVMGGTEINLIQADIQAPIGIDATNIFGGTKLIVPSTWDVHSEVVAIFGGVDDKRHITNETPDPNKVIKLTGTCLFGGIEIKNF